eukprot:CAMPEP_0172841234 /NCGR_PEP_ID=MMETSP1075-20121228/29873_1 /TAXON_ID=2916 /ORGANISM="Ceratium fusus, Strain PA161109" /LENGTH=130 /DNA_ID=CAMNT_0013685191 /DNA_START=333 /DNA_END=721 /DNA_ORIENTATION=+
MVSWYFLTGKSFKSAENGSDKSALIVRMALNIIGTKTALPTVEGKIKCKRQPMLRVPAMEPPHHAVGKSRADVAQLHEHAQEVDIRHRHRAIQEVTDQRNTGTSLVDDADDGALERDVRDQSSFNEVIDN